MSNFGDVVWERSGRDEISRNQFMFLYMFWTFAGIALSGFCATISLNWEVTWWLFLVPFVVAIVGIFIALGSSVPIVSLLGYTLVCGPMGLMIGPVVNLYTEASVIKVLFVTAVLVLVLGFLGAVIPESLKSWGAWLFGGLTIMIVGHFGLLLGHAFGIPVEGALTLWDWVGIFLFGGYVIYDVNQAYRVPATYDNAIDCALALYLDFANLFIRLLEIMGTKKSDD